MEAYQVGLKDNKTGEVTGALTFIACEHFVTVRKAGREVMRLGLAEFLVDPVATCREASKALTGTNMAAETIEVHRVL